MGAWSVMAIVFKEEGIVAMGLLINSFPILFIIVQGLESTKVPRETVSKPDLGQAEDQNACMHSCVYRLQVMDEYVWVCE